MAAFVRRLEVECQGSLCKMVALRLGGELGTRCMSRFCTARTAISAPTCPPQMWVHVFNPTCTERPTRMTLTALYIQFPTVENPISGQGKCFAKPAGGVCNDGREEQDDSCPQIDTQALRRHHILLEPNMPYSSLLNPSHHWSVPSSWSYCGSMDDVLSSPVTSSDTRTRLDEVTSGDLAAVRSYDFALTK